MDIQKIISKKDGIELEIAIAEPKQEAKGIIQISHGMAEHKERYYDFMNYLAENGYICIIHDHRGHGASVKQKQDLGYFYSEDINYIVDDLYQVTEFIKNKYKGLEVVLFSHSMGTLVARNYLKKYDSAIKKIILCGPPTENKLADLGILIARISKLFKKDNTRNKFLNKLTFGTYNNGNKIENEWICSNTETVKKYNQDELCGYIFTTNGFINLFKMMKQAFNKENWKLGNRDLNILVIAGKDDPVIQSEAKFNDLVKFLIEIGYKNIESKLYESKRHELLNENENEKIYEDILKFIEKN